MNVPARKADIAAATRQRLIDCDIHPMMRSPGHLKTYLSKRWQEHFDQYGDCFRQPFYNADTYSKVAPFISRRDAYPPAGGPPGSDLAFMREQLLDLHHVDLGVLQVLTPTGASQRNMEYGAAITSGLNTWQIAEWLEPEPRLRGSLVVAQEYPEAAVEEIHKHGRDRRFVQVSFAPRSLEPAGRRRYWPIYAAAQEHDLPIGLHTTGNPGYPPLPGGGWPSYYAEQHQLVSMGSQATLTSLVFEGVFEAFPRLRVIFIEGGFSWVPALSWRMDRLWNRMRSEVPHVKRPPSEYIKERVWFTTQPLDEMRNGEELRQVVDWVGWDRLCFSSDYPHWDYDDVRYAFPFKMTEPQRALVFHENATTLFKF